MAEVFMPTTMVVNCTVVDNTTVNNGSGGGISIGVKPIIINSVFLDERFR